MHGDGCRGRWCIHGTLSVGLRVRCQECGLVVLTSAAWAGIDPEAYTQFIDPDGLQRAFMDATGLRAPRW